MKALEIAVAIETAIHDTSQLQNEFHPEQPRVEKISDNSKTTPILPPPPKPTVNPCYLCGGHSHAMHNCKFKEKGGTHFKSLWFEIIR